MAVVIVTRVWDAVISTSASEGQKPQVPGSTSEYNKAKPAEMTNRELFVSIGAIGSWFLESEYQMHLTRAPPSGRVETRPTRHPALHHNVVVCENLPP
jgi:hypothetical protein